MRVFLPSWLPRAAAEAVLIVFAVVLGFLVNEWREGQDERERAQLALARIVDELEGNLEALERAAAYHASTAEALGELEQQLADGNLGSRGALLSVVAPAIPQGISPPILSDVAWTYAGQTGALDQLDFAVMADVARLYSVQELGAQSTWQMIAETFFFNEESFEEHELTGKLSYMRLAFVELASQERYLVAEYSSVLPQVRAVLD